MNHPDSYRLQLETVAENATLALFIMDEHQRCTYMNRAAEEMTGFRLEELQGKALHYYLHHTRPDGTPYPLEECPIDQAFPQNMRESGEEVFVHRDGHFYPVAFTASPIRRDGVTVGTIIEVREISAERAARAEHERVLRELEVERGRLTTVFDRSASYMAVVRGPDHIFEMANPLYRQLTGDRDLIGRPAREAIPELVEQGYIALLDRVRDTGVPFTATEARVLFRRNPDGPLEEHFINFVYQPLPDADGAVSAILGHGVDVTEVVRARQLAEEQAAELEAVNEELIEANRRTHARAEESEEARARMEAVLGSIADAFYLLDRDWRFIYVNDAAEPLLQTTRERLLGRTLWDAFPGVIGSVFEAPYREAMATGRVTSAEAYFDPLGTWFDVRTYPWSGGLMVHFRDVGARKRVEAERERLLADAEAARAAAEAANRAKSEFLAMMSHELRTPLNAIGGYAQLIEMGIHGPVTEAQHTALRRIQQSQRHLLGLINEVLNYARLENGMVTYEIADVSVREVLASAEVLIEPQAQTRGLTLQIGECSAALTARADPEKLRQIVLNLASNAVKFTDAGGVIEIACQARGDVVELRVRDTGIGIPADKLETIFEPFVQVRADLTRTAEGTGLGLAISRDLARGMGGELTVESAPGEGSTFTIHLPRTGAGPADEPRAAALSSRALTDVAQLLLDHRDAILGAYTARIRRDPVLGAASADEADLSLQDHVVNFLAGVAQSLSARSADPDTAGELSDDTDTIQRTVAELHGAQRRRIGFSEEALRLDWVFLREETARMVRERTSGEPETAAVLDLLERIFERAETFSQRGWRRSAGAAQPEH